ncbi:MAG: Phosphate transport regulator (distant homolog of PhoU) [uncultured Chloroflexi bacterium]|uniref:Phosphate transport regulator (Distant homolog of PhoU) n=1 Tax=uncultured Chloroflexota bacterium TaxID=166587 RepID=A0A6J4JVS4_9CHLR|nr:MAG: Phosphate transport regulator (distant homolog of PhoU) [uncultured Chloroflexota bacterium]
MFGLNLIPRDARFYDYFEAAGANLLATARALDDLLGAYSDVPAKLERLKELERTGDTITRDVMRALNRTFITPLDREDITALVRALDDVVDKAWAAAVRLDLYAIQEPTETARRLAHTLVAMAEALTRALPFLRHRGEMQQIIPITEELDRLETEADEHLRAALGQLFANPHTLEDVVLGVKWREIYDFLEGATDMADDAANVLESIVLKHG